MAGASQVCIILLTEHHEASPSISSWESTDSAKLFVREVLDLPEPGTESNPIVVEDDPAPLGSASNPIVIYDDEEWCHDEAEQLGSGDDTDIMSTPEFWEDFTPPACENPEELGVLGQSSVDSFRLADEATKEKTVKASEDHYVAVLGDVQSSQAENGQSKIQGILPEAKEPTPVCNTSDTRSMKGQFGTQERPYGTDISTVRDPSQDSCDRESTKRKCADDEGVSSDPRRSKCLIKRARK
ncbi:uncharacterized protein N7498_007887 [Penicillium cinerascens]|uniref:Uncharacterized protein n=1 Tax=Penicillium cinerascens TaxID=70096 RepID=A0A9W9JKQ5_9EURO|nr:uncharacterized protein N7498_007887 [Penicillium cinerascens]KAJ5198770.1 hypothetical protein N7498_007887 [Penicillium cinerascens]